MISRIFPRHTIILFLCLLLPSGIHLQAQFAQTVAGLDRFNTLNVNEQVYIHTDREVYAPGDTIWFKAYIRSKLSLYESNLSKLLHIGLVNEDGVQMHDAKFAIEASQSAGYLLTLKDTEAGSYTLIAYSSWMMNFNPESTFSKKLLIAAESNEGYRFVPYFDQTEYLPGDTVKVRVKCFSNFDKEDKNKRFRYRFLLDEKNIQNGVSNTSNTEPSPILFVVPESLGGLPELHIWDDSEELRCNLPINLNIAVDFFPEGGNSLIDQFGMVAFKAVYSNGMPASIEGDIVDEQGGLLTSITSEHDGMGKFVFTPRSDLKYSLKITSPEAYKNLYPLPDGKENAWAIEARSINHNIHVNIKNNAEVFDTCLLVLAIRGYNYYFKLVPSREMASFSIPTDDLPAGIAVLTLLDKNKLPRAERLVFVNHDRFLISKIGKEKEKYLARDSVTLMIDIMNDEFSFENGQYSLSVYDNMFGGSELIDAPNIISSNYLSPEIRGFIYNPNYYFESHGKTNLYHLDLLLMTQGWRNYSYLDELDMLDSLKAPEIQDYISGYLEKLKFGSDPVPAEGEVLIYFAGNSERIATDAKGTFSFLPEFTRHRSAPIMLTGYGIKGKEKIILRLDEDPFQVQLDTFLSGTYDTDFSTFSQPLYLYEDIERKMEVSSRTSIWIDEVEIEGTADMEFKDMTVGLIEGLGQVRKTTPAMLVGANDIEDAIVALGFNAYRDNEFLMVFNRGGLTAAKFVVDGIDYGYDYSFVKSFYTPFVIKTIYVITGNEAQMFYKANVVVYIESDDSSIADQIYEDNRSSTRTLRGLPVYKEFYSPTYRTEEERNLAIPDLRKTIFWDPEIKINSEGKAAITFFNGDRYTRVKCVLEGITETGVPVYGETYYDVTTYRE